MKKWLPLRAGDRVDIVAPASPASSEETVAAKRFLKDQGFLLGLSAAASSRHPYLAGEDLDRARDFIRSLRSPSRAMWCLRGGYGSARILQALAEVERPKGSKLFVGLSDITALHLFLNQRWGWSTLHAPVLTRFGMRRGPIQEVKEVLAVVRGERPEIRHRLVPFNPQARRAKVIEGKVRGGNLVVLQSLIGTPVHPRLRDCFVFLEDVGERGYRLDRTLDHLLRAGIFDGVRGMLLGDFVGGDEPDGRNFVKRALREFSERVAFPVWAGIRSGHGDIQRPVALETRSVIEKAGTHHLLIQESGVRS